MGRPASHGLPRGPWYSGTCPGLRASAPTGLSPAGALHSNSFGSTAQSRCRSTYADKTGPQPVRGAGMSGHAAHVWTRPGSLAATTGFADAFSTQVLRCFSSPLWTRFRPVANRPDLPVWGFPHSVTLGSLRATPLPEAFRGVPRPSSPHPHPRHPPCAGNLFLL